MSELEYLSVPFAEKDIAKGLGAKWDAAKKFWYIPLYLDRKNKMQLHEIYQITNLIHELAGENRTFGGNELFVDLIPRTCWFTNVRSCIHDTEWDRVRKYIYERVDYKCECCGIDPTTIGRNLEAHERWSYNYRTQTQKLERIIALCSDCHQVTHMGLAGLKGKADEAKAHLMKVRRFTEKECEEHIKKAFATNRTRSAIEWHLDISLIENNGITIAQPVSIEDRRRVAMTV